MKFVLKIVVGCLIIIYCDIVVGFLFDFYFKLENVKLVKKNDVLV